MSTKTEIILKIKRSAAEEALMRRSKPKYQSNSTVWLAKVSIKPGGRVIAEVSKLKVVRYHASVAATVNDVIYLYTLKDDNGSQYVVPPTRVFSNEVDAAEKVYRLLSALAENLQKLAYEFFKLCDKPDTKNKR